jgi:hypothetical protein
MTQSNWCNQNHWYLDDTLSTKSTFIPRDTIDDTNIVTKNYTYVIAENACFQKIPSLVCNNLNIIVGQNAQPNAAGSFTCALLEANNVICDKNITLAHWEPNTFCEWTISSLSTASGCNINYLILDANSSSGTGLYTTYSSLQSCYVKTNNLYLDNTSVSSSDYITKILCTSGTLVSSTINNRVICEGDFAISGTTTFGGSGNGSFVFNESSINAGTINGLTTFNDSSINQGIVYSNVLFSGASSNNGIVVGDCVFLSGTTNLGMVSGNAIFSGSSINSGTIIDNSFFNSGAINFGTVLGISKFDYAINNGTVSESYFTRSINATDGVATGLSVFNESINSGILNNLSIDFSFINNSINRGTIFGNVVLDSGCTNRGLIYSPSGYVIFKKDSINYENIESNSITFTDDSQNGYGDGVTNTSGLTIFSKNAINYGTIGGSGSVEFYNSSLNNIYGTFNSGNFYHNSINRGTLNIAYFHQDAANFKTVSSGIFNDTSINKPEGSGNNLCFNNNAINSGFAGNGNFADSSCNFGTGINLQFCHRATNSGTSLEHAIFWGSSINLSGAVNSGFVTFNDTSRNYSSGMIDCRFVFKNKSANYGNVYSGIFQDFSKNNINTTGYNLNFYDDSSNNGTITNLGLFMGRSLNKGIVLNSGIFYNLSSNQSPAVIQNSLFLHYSSNNSSYKIDYKNTPNMNTPKIVFSGYSVNQGNIVDCYVQFGDHATNKNSIEWNSKILFTSSGIFIPEIDQDGKEKYFHFSGPDGTYETDVSEFIRKFYNCIVSSFYSWPQIIFNDYSTNSGNLKGYYNYIFNNHASNYGSLYTYPVIPNLHSIAFFDGASKQSGCLNAGSIVNGKTVFNNSINSGTVLFPYFENSINYGDIIGAPTVSYYPDICNGFYLEGVSGVQFINSTNFGRMNLFGSFEESINFGNINSSGSFDNSKNFGFIANNAIFINSYSNGDIGGNLDMTNSTCISSNIRGKANFINSTYYGHAFLNNLLTYSYYYNDRIAEDESWIPNINNILSFMSLAFDPIRGSLLQFNGETISNDANFINSKNFGGHLMTSAYFQNGINFGDIEGFSHFVNSSVNAYNSTLRGISIFEDSTNYGILNAKNFDTNINGFPNIYYNEYIIDSGILINYPQLSGFISSNKIGSILDNSTNKGTINTPSIFTTSINYYLINGPTAFIAQSNNNKNNNMAYGYNEAISYIPPYPLYSPPIYIYRYNPPSTETYSRPHIIQAGYGLINSNAIFINSDNNAAVQNAIFYQSNNNGIVQGEAVLNNSWNYGSIVGENTIFNYSTNYNEVSGNAIFISGSNGSNGLVTGDAVFVSGSCNSVFARVLGQIANDGTMSTNC